MELHRGSIPRVGVKAATAAGRHPYPSRTRKLSPPALRQVLECASLWETRFAASHSYLHPESAKCWFGVFSFRTRGATATNTLCYRLYSRLTLGECRRGPLYLSAPSDYQKTAPRWQSPAERSGLQSRLPPVQIRPLAYYPTLLSLLRVWLRFYRYCPRQNCATEDNP